MASWVALSRTDHADKHWRPRSGYGFASTQQIVPIMLDELTKLLPHYVLGFVLTDAGDYQAVALLGVGGARNLYVTPDDKWLGSYVPAEFGGFPFALLNSNSDQRVFCIEESFLSDDETHPRLFDSEGQLEGLAGETFNFINQREGIRSATTKAVAQLSQANLIEPWSIKINIAEGGEPLSINGLYKINEDALNKLDVHQFSDLRGSGALAMAYAQMFSIGQMQQLAERSKYLKHAKTQGANLAELDNLFSNDDSGSLNFDAFDSSSDDTDTK